ncbi:hypothetical protein BU16DRAFT_523034 [Lophium mytilinum]|uniref:F-box domain-containing protein n=1 Tax=Lophium mytilinum TaxID=390894 RepID=A0A6A6R9T3_9PEZI|nr:hypothetical protein BU16DRAFT_523034 [Lophium mytilinum]
MDNPLNVAHAFRQLPSSTARAVALDALINELNHTEWRQMLARLGGETFWFDIVGSLPVEIVIQVFSYLDISTPFQLQRVSRRWQTVLSSPDVLRGLICLLGYDSGLPAGLRLPGQSPDVDQDYLHCRKTAEYVHRFQAGVLARSIMIDLPPGAACSVTYSSFEDTIAWPKHDACAVTVLNLRSGKLLSFTGEARETITEIALSDQLVVFFTFTGVWYAGDIVTGQRKSFRLPSAHIPVFSCRGRTIAGVMRYENGYDEHVAYIWDFDTQKCRTFDLRTPRHSSSEPDPTGEAIAVSPPLAMLVDPTSESVLICSRLASRSDSLCSDALLYHRYSYTGVLIRSGSMNDIPKMSPPVYFKPVDRRGRFKLYFRTKTLAESQADPGEYCLTYDESEDHFGHPNTRSIGYRRDAWWLGAHYRIDYAHRVPVPEPSLGCVLNSMAFRCLHELRYNEYEWFQEHDPLQLNDSFLALTGRRFIRIWAFDKDFSFEDIPPFDRVSTLEGVTFF